MTIQKHAYPLNGLFTHQISVHFAAYLVIYELTTHTENTMESRSLSAKQTKTML